MDERLSILAKNIKYVRTTIEGVSQEEFASILGVTQATVSEYEREKKIPPIEKILKIHDRHNIPIGDLFECDLQSKRRMIAARDETVVGSRVISAGILERYENIELFCYYVSGTNDKVIREGKLILNSKSENDGYVQGELLTSSQSYFCKLVIEHPQYIYIFGTNKNTPERMLLYLHEPRYNKKEKKYKGGMALSLSEGGKRLPVFQKVILSEKKIDLSCVEKKDKLMQFLVILDSITEYYLPKEIDSEIYEWVKKYGNS